MMISPGSRLGPYEVLSPLGAGGMGEVYRARDTKLNRNIAVKVLPESSSNDREALARFEREALYVIEGLRSAGYACRSLRRRTA